MHGSWYEYHKAHPVKDEKEFIRHDWEFMNPGKRIGETLPAGNYEWPFEMILPGNTPESVEGLPESWVIYRMKAKIERGLLQQNAVVRRHVRVIRTLDPSSLELAHEMVGAFCKNSGSSANGMKSVDNVWVNKLDYCLSTPTKGVIFGTAVRINFKLIPLLKGLRIGKIKIMLNQSLDVGIYYSARLFTRKKTNRAIVKDEWTLPEDTETEDIEGAEGYRFSRTLELPKSLRECIQTVDTIGIKTRHSLMINIQMHNPDSHVSEVIHLCLGRFLRNTNSLQLHATLPLMIFLSPSLPLDENNNMIHRASQTITAEALTSAPPMYGEHRFDQLYNDVDPSGYMTPAGGVSGIATPFYSQSASTSNENLASMDMMASGDLPPSILQHRLNDLEVSGASRFARDRSHASASEGATPEPEFQEGRQGEDATHLHSSGRSYFDSSHGSTSRHSDSNPISRRVSEEDPWTATGHHVEFGSEEMSKVPSYSTALQARAMPISDSLPNYQTAVSTSGPSPSLSRTSSQAQIPTRGAREGSQQSP